MLLVSLSIPHLPWDWCVSSTLDHWPEGVFVFLTDTDTGVTYCRVVWRSLDTPDNMSLCPSSNGPLSTGVYSVEVYAIERDGSVSSVPALAGEIVAVFGPSAVYVPSSTVYVISSSSISTTDQGTIVNINIYSIEGSMCSYEQNVPFIVSIPSIPQPHMNSLHGSTKHFLTNIVQYNQI